MKCKHCNTEFVKKGIKVFCSRKCNVDYWHNIEKEKINSCSKLKEQKNLRSRQWYRNKKGLDPNAPLLIGKKGEGHITQGGYRGIRKPKHPNSHKNGVILEHIYIMSEYLKRSLMKGETVHHKNGIRTDNRIENLELWSSHHCKGQRVEDKIKWCIDFLEIYGYDINKKNKQKPPMAQTGQEVA